MKQPTLFFSIIAMLLSCMSCEHISGGVLESKTVLVKFSNETNDIDCAPSGGLTLFFTIGYTNYFEDSEGNQGEEPINVLVEVSPGENAFLPSQFTDGKPVTIQVSSSAGDDLGQITKTVKLKTYPPTDPYEVWYDGPYSADCWGFTTFGSGW